jgi:hypothetical protein
MRYVLLALVLTGCSHYVYYRDGGTYEEMAKDRFECKRDATAMTPKAHGVLGVVGRSDLMDECMQSKGYGRIKSN